MTFMKTNSAGDIIEREFLMLKKDETNDPTKGLERLRSMGWNIGDLDSVDVKGQIVKTKKAY